MDIAQDTPETVFLAEDEASLYLQATTMRVWAPVGQTPVVRVHTGRENTNFYGCLNLQTGTEIVMQAETMNSATTAAYLKMIANAIPDKPILLLWDRAPWHRGSAGVRIAIISLLSTIASAPRTLPVTVRTDK